MRLGLVEGKIFESQEQENFLLLKYLSHLWDK